MAHTGIYSIEKFQPVLHHVNAFLFFPHSRLHRFASHFNTIKGGAAKSLFWFWIVLNGQWASVVDVKDVVNGDGAGFNGVRTTVGSLDDAIGVRTGVETQSAQSQFQFGAGADVEFGGRAVTAVEFDGRLDDGRTSGALAVDVAQVVAVTVLLLVEHVDPAVEAEHHVLFRFLSDVGVLPSAGRLHTWDGIAVAAEPDGVQRLFERGNISIDLACVKNVSIDCPLICHL